MSAQRSSRRTIFYGFLLVITVLVAITAIGLYRIQHLSSGLTEVVKERDVQIALMHTMRQAARERSITLQSMMIIKDPFSIDEYAMEMSAAAAHYVAARKKLLLHHLSTLERNLLEQQHNLSSKTGQSQNRIVDFLRNEQYAPASELLFYTTLPGQRHAMGLMDNFITLKREQNLKSLQSTSQAISKTYSLMLLLSIFGVLISITIAMVIHRRINNEIERRETTENDLRHSELRERTIRENILDGLLTLDAQGRILSCNKACKTIFGYENQTLLGKSARILMPQLLDANSDDLSRYLAVWEKRMLGIGREVMGSRANSETFPAEIDLSKIEFDGEPVYIVVVRDISGKKEAQRRLQQFNLELERRVEVRTEELGRTNEKLRHEVQERIRAQQELKHQATHDPLTGLPNRALFHEQLECMLQTSKRHQRRMALLFLDLDGFKVINDTYGHDAGDHLLKIVSQRMRKIIRQEDMLARMGGDEFTILLGDLQSAEDSQLVAQKLITEISRPIPVDDCLYQVGVSIGISHYPDTASNSDTLLRLADDAMYAAKGNGKNTFSIGKEKNAILLEPTPAPTSA